jgi:UDP-N-acetyl-D-glucosamine dehydrogenase
MPLFIVSRLTDALNDREKSVRGSRILVLGVAYKKNIDDVRESPALDILRVLRTKGAEVSFADPYVPTLRLNGEELAAVEITPEVLASQDCVVITTDHAVFDYESVAEHAPLVFDTRNATRPLGVRDNIVRL